MTLTQKTYLFLQNAKITITEVSLLVYSDTQYVIQDKAMKKNSSNKCEARLFQKQFFPSTVIDWNKIVED